jgi:hypothetical protein
MGWWEDMQAAVTPAATLTTLVIRFSEAFQGPKPTLDLTLGDGVDQNERELIFTAFLSETANRVPAMRVHVFAEIEGEGLVFEADPFNLAAGELDYDVPVTLRRPEHGTKVPECNHAVTLYGASSTSALPQRTEELSPSNGSRTPTSPVQRATTRCRPLGGRPDTDSLQSGRSSSS